MARHGNVRFRLARAAIFILLEFAALSMLKSSSSLEDIWINRASRRVQALLWSSGESLRGYFTLGKVNRELAEANAALMEELETYRLADTSRTPALTGGSGKFVFTPATIVKMSRNSSHNYIILDKGYEDGIRPHSGIVTTCGAIGIVESTGRHHSYGLTLMNSNISISSRIGKSGVTGPLVWDGTGSRYAYIKDIPTHIVCQKGDTVFTSGFSSIFPPDIPLGTVIDSEIYDGATRRAKVDLFQEFSSLRFVSVVYNTDREEIESLENSELNTEL